MLPVASGMQMASNDPKQTCSCLLLTDTMLDGESLPSLFFIEPLRRPAESLGSVFTPKRRTLYRERMSTLAERFESCKQCRDAALDVY